MGQQPLPYVVLEEVNEVVLKKKRIPSPQDMLGKQLLSLLDRRGICHPQPVDQTLDFTNTMCLDHKHSHFHINHNSFPLQ